MSRVLVWSPNYAPELTGIPPLVTDACEWLAEQGHDVDVVTAFPNYPERRIPPAYRGRLRRDERRGAVDVRRSWLRVRPEERFLDKVLYELTFSAFSAGGIAARVRRSDVLLCVVPCLSAAAISTAAVRMTRPRVPLVLWVQDLVLRAASSLDGVGPAARRVLGASEAVERAVLRRADRVIVCSPAFAAHASGAGVAPARIETIYNWVDLERIAATPPLSHDGPTRLLYAGNLGYTQGFESLVEAAQLAGESVSLKIVGDGNAAATVRRLAATAPNVVVRPPVPDEAYPELLASADVHVVVQREISSNANFPSKIASSLASGRPIIASISPASAAAAVLAASGGAVVVPPDAPEALAAAMRAVAENPGLRSDLAARGRAYAERHFGRAQALTKLESVLMEVSRRSRAG